MQISCFTSILEEFKPIADQNLNEAKVSANKRRGFIFQAFLSQIANDECEDDKIIQQIQSIDPYVDKCTSSFHMLTLSQLLNMQQTSHLRRFKNFQDKNSRIFHNFSNPYKSWGVCFAATMKTGGKQRSYWANLPTESRTTRAKSPFAEGFYVLITYES